jgi:hypothetical protein
MDNNQGEPLPEQDIQDTQPQQRKQPRMLTNLARYNLPWRRTTKTYQAGGTNATNTRWQQNARRRGTGSQNRTCNTGKNSKG